MGHVTRIISSAFFVSLVLSGCCRMKNTKAVITFFEHGVVVPVKIEDTDQFIEQVNDLILGTDDTIQLLVSPERIGSLKQGGSGIEIIFDKTVLVRSKKLGIFRIDRILIPFEGEFVGTETSPSLVVFLGKETYFSGPIQNSKGFGYIKELRSLLESKQDINP